MLLDFFDEAYERKAWHGPNLKGSIRGLSPQLAAWRPDPARHNIWEHVLHAAYWKYVVRRRLLGEKRGSFPLKGSNWFVRPEAAPAAAAWRGDAALLDQMHRALREAIVALDSSELSKRPAGSKVSNAAILRGIAAHDVYHAGQIQLLKRLAGQHAWVAARPRGSAGPSD
jgi:uncharacterized damage-inducible protein DinB